MHFSLNPYDHIAEVIFVGDPMCSWCYGFGVELNRVRETLKEVPFQLLMGGLRDGDIFDADKLKNHLSYWDAVHAMTGLPFDATALSQEGFNYTTEPACRAVVTAKFLDQGQSYALYQALQQAFYAHGRDITRESVIVEVAKEVGYDEEAFREYFNSALMLRETTHEKQKAATYGVSSFPTLITVDKEGHMSQIRGYKKYEVLMALLRK